MNFQEMQTEVFRRLDEDSVSPAFWSLVDVKQAINEGYDDLSELTEWRETSSSLSLANSNYYDLSTLVSDVVLTLYSVRNAQTSKFLDQGTVKQLDTWYRRWEAVIGGEPERYWIRGLYWLGMFPNKGAASGTVTLYYTALPAALSANADTPGFPQEFHLALVDYAVYDLLCQDREYEKAARLWASYQERVAKLRRYVQGRAEIPLTRRLGG